MIYSHDCKVIDSYFLYLFRFEKYDLLWCVDPYYVQVAKVDALFIHKTCTGASLSPGVVCRDWRAWFCAM